MSFVKPDFKFLAPATLQSLVFFLFLFFPLQAQVEQRGTKYNSFEPLYLENLEIVKNENQESSLQLTRQPYQLTRQEQLNSIYFSFDKDTALENLGRQKNLVESSSYQLQRYPDSCGYAATFNLLRHKLSVRLPKFIFLSRSEAVGNFSIHMRIHFSQLRQDMEILRKIGVFEGRKQGLRASWRDNRVIFEFYNFFWNENSPLPYSKIESKDSIAPQRFYSLLLVYRESDGSLTLLLDGQEQARIYLTSNSQKGGTILIPRFHPWDKSSLVIGENFFGALDDIIFSNEILSHQSSAATYGEVEKQSSRFTQRKGVYVSKRFALRYSGGTLSDFKMQGNYPQDTRVELFMRASDLPFDENIGEDVLPFVKVASSQQGNVSKGLRGKFYQWKAEFFSDPLGKQTPVLQSIEIKKEENLPPAPPQNLHVAESNPDSVTLRFSRSNEVDVISGGRYHIYYGIKPYSPLGILRFEKLDNQGSPIFFTDAHRASSDSRYAQYITVKITNQIIQDNLLYSRNNPLWQMEYPLLQKNIPLYFWVTSLDSAWSGGEENFDHESNPSNATVARVE